LEALPLRLCAAAQPPQLWRGLTSGAGALVVGTGTIAALASGWLLLRRRFVLARFATIAQVVFLLLGWGVAQHPYLVYPTLTIAAAAAPRATLDFVLATLPLGLALVVPSLVWLLRVFKRPPAEGSA